MNFLATNPSDAFNHVIWTLIIPAMFVASLVAFLIPIFLKKLEQFVTRMFRQSSSPGPRPKKSEPQSFDPLCPTDDTAPHCPTCNRVMVVRKARRGTRQGSSFWGCPAYPDCRGTREINIR
jgi:hypothetical protein